MATYDTAQKVFDCINTCAAVPAACHTYIGLGARPALAHNDTMSISVLDTFPTDYATFPGKVVAASNCRVTEQAASVEVTYYRCLPLPKGKAVAITDTEMNNHTQAFLTITDQVKLTVDSCFSPRRNQPAYAFESETYSNESNSSVYKLRFKLLLSAECFTCKQLA